jgi:hypothetical protein
VDNNRQLFTVQGLHLNGLGKDLLSSNLLLHIYSALKEEAGLLITLAWQDSNSQISPSTVDGHSSLLAISDNQKLINNYFILDNSISKSCLDKDNLSNHTVNGILSAGISCTLKTRTSSIIRKTPVAKKYFLW